MAAKTGRTVGKYARAYVDGYDLSGEARSIGELQWSFEPNVFDALTDEVKGALPGQCTISVGDINAILKTNTGATDMHNVFSAGSDAVRDVMIPIGIREAPVSGSPVFCAQVSQNNYQMNDPGEGAVTVTLGLGNWDERADTTGSYPFPWGWMIHAKEAETTANSGTADYTFGSQTTHGGYMMYQVFPGSTGTVTLKRQDSTGGAYSDLISSGVLTQTATTGQAAIKALGDTGTVDSALRFQVALGTATTTTFALAFVRGRANT